MATASKCGPQDMPPAGGYADIPYQRTRLKGLLTAKSTIGILLAATGIGFYDHFVGYRRYKIEMLEMQSSRHCLYPLLIAERDRAFLKQLRKNRDDERELMKAYPEWEVGTYFREPCYITLPKDVWMDPEYWEFFAHSDAHDPKGVWYRFTRRLWQ